MRPSFFFVLLFWLFLAVDSFAQIDAYVQMDFQGPLQNDPLQFVVTDTQGRRSGYDPITRQEYDEIPYAGYGFSGVGSLTPNKPSISVREFGFITSLQDTLFSTSYVVQLFGNAKGMFIGDISMRQTWSGKGADFHVVGVIDSDQTVSYLFRYGTDSTVTPTMTKLVTPHTIRQDLDNSFKLNLLGEADFYNNLANILTSFEEYLAQSDTVSARQELILFQQAIDNENKDTTNTTIAFVNADAWNILHGDAQSLIDLFPVPPPRLIVNLVNSVRIKLVGGSLQYYDGSWKNAVNNNDGTFSITTTKTTLNLRMTYAYSAQTKSNVTVGNDTVVFQTVAVQVKLQNSQGSLIDTGTVQYYAGAWRDFGTTTNGIATKELLPVNYSFRMAYAFASNDKAQDLSTNTIVVFQTINAFVQLKDSQGNLIDQGAVQYYSGAWRDFGVTASVVATKELLPNNYSFRMTYAFASNDKQQDLNTNSVVVFQTVNAQVRLQSSQGNPIDQGTVQYYSGAWRSLGSTSSGVAAKELLPNNYSFRMTYAFASNDKQQDLNTNSIVVFQTVNTSVQLKDSQGNFIDQGTVQYYSGAWRDFGTTTNGITTKQLLPNSYQFRMTYAYVSNDKTQDIGSNNTVGFSTVLTTVRVKDTQNNPVNNAIVTYYSGAWRQFGNTVNGDITKELLPANLQFRAKLGSVQQDKTQNLSTNPLVEITLISGQ